MKLLRHKPCSNVFASIILLVFITCLISEHFLNAIIYNKYICMSHTLELQTSSYGSHCSNFFMCDKFIISVTMTIDIIDMKC